MSMASSASFDFGDLGGLQPLTGDWGYSRGQPVDRLYIEQFLSRHRHDIRGDVVEIGDDTYTRQFGGARVSKSSILDRPGNAKATIVADLRDAPEIPDGSFDCVILTQVLVLIRDFEAALRTVSRILKPGGVALITMPGISQISTDAAEAAAWSWSFYPQTFRSFLAKHFDPQKELVQSYGNVKTTIAFLAGLAREDLSRADFQRDDSRYPLIVAARAVKPGPPRRAQAIGYPGRQPTISVLMRLFNAAAHVGEAIESVRAQSFDAWELIVVDDGSTDESYNIVRRFAENEPGRIRVLQHPDCANHGASETGNRALAEASGEYVAFLDADDIWMPERLAHDVAVLDENPAVAAVLSNSLYWWTDEDRPAEVDAFNAPHNSVWPARSFFRSAWLRHESSVPCPSALTARTHLLRGLGGFDVTFPVAEDMKMIAELAFRHPVYVTDACNTEYRRTRGSLWSRAIQDGRDADSRRRFLTWMRTLIDREAADDPTLHAEYVANLSHCSAASLVGRSILGSAGPATLAAGVKQGPPTVVGPDTAKWSTTLWLEAGRYILQVLGTRLEGEPTFVLDAALLGGGAGPATVQGILPPVAEGPGGPRVLFEVPPPARTVTLTVSKTGNSAALLHGIEVRAEGWTHELPRLE
jgi:SAM-dependent methyltransferase